MSNNILNTWTITGSDNEAIIGNTHFANTPNQKPLAIIVMVHGFLGYKDYGFFPYFARSFADAGFAVHRFNLGHSGMTNEIDTFARPDLFEHDSWNHQVTDVKAVMAAVRQGELSNCTDQNNDCSNVPIVLWGHSRGGVTALLTAGRLFRDCGDSTPDLAGVMTIAAPSFTNRMTQVEQNAVLDAGYAEVTSGRTGQSLRIDAQWLTEQIDQPEDHDLLSLVAYIHTPMLITHGKDDPTVPATCVNEIAAAAVNATTPVQTLLAAGGNHVLNTVNPMPPDSEPSAQLAEVRDACVGFVNGLI